MIKTWGHNLSNNLVGLKTPGHTIANSLSLKTLNQDTVSFSSSKKPEAPDFLEELKEDVDQYKLFLYEICDLK